MVAEDAPPPEPGTRTRWLAAGQRRKQANAFPGLAERGQGGYHVPRALATQPDRGGREAVESKDRTA